MSEWQPIETAPKVEHVDVLLDGPLGIGVGHWEPEIEQEDEDGTPTAPIPSGWWGERGYWPAEADQQPTHWMQLPDRASSALAGASSTPREGA